MARSKAKKDEIRRLRRRVQQKMYRIRKANPDIELNSVNPLFALGAEDTMSLKGANDYIKSMTRFLDRRTQFVTGSKGIPIPKRLWTQYKRVETRANRALAEQNKSFATIMGPDGMTLAQAMEMYRPAIPQLLNESANSYYYPTERSSLGFSNSDQLVKAIDQMMDRSRPEFLRDQIPRYRDTIMKIAERMGDLDLWDKIYDLDDRQLDLLYRGTNFMSATSLKYDYYKAMFEGSKSSVPSEAIEKVGERANAYVEWAAKQ